MNKIDMNLVNYFVLRKQHLTDDSKIDDIIKIVKDISGLHATSSTTPYLSLLARTKKFTRDSLDEELYVKRNLGKIRCVRKTVYIIEKDRVPVVFAATKNMIEPHSERYSRSLGVTERDYGVVSKKILQILKGAGMTTREIKKELKMEVNISSIINLLCDQGLLIRGAPRKGWKSNLHTYFRFDEYFPGMDLNKFDEKEARKSTVKRYIGSFGPVTENDISWWMGFPKREIKEILEYFDGSIMNVEISGSEGDYIMMASDDKLLTTERVNILKKQVNLLPSLDPYIMGYKDRERYLDKEHYNFVFDRSGNATSTILIDGRVAGIWDFVEPFVKIFLFNKTKPDVLKDIYSNAKKFGAFISGKKVTVNECDSITPLTQRTSGGFMSPLKYS